MSKIFDGYTAEILALVTLLLLVIYSYKKYVAPYTVFPQSWAVAKIAAHFVTGRIPKDTSMSCFIFQTVLKDLKKYLPEGYCVVWIPKPYLFIFNEEAIKTLNTSQAALNKAEVYHVLHDSYGNGLATSDEALWRKQKKIIHPAFHASLLKNHVPNFNRNANKLVESLMETKNEPVKSIHFIARCTFHNLMASAFGLENDNLIEPAEQNEMMALLETMGPFITQRFMNPFLRPKSLLPYSAAGRKYIETLKIGMVIMHKFILRVKALTLKRLAEKPSAVDEEEYASSHRKSFVEALVDVHLKDPSFTMKEVNEQCITLLIAGYDTVAYALLWCLLELGHHPDVQDQIYEEVEHLKGREITYEDVMNLTYTECVLKEALRLHASVPFYARRLTADVQFGKYNLPKGTNIVAALYLLHRNPEVYPDPEKFDPERFRKGANKNPWSFTPFADGIRECVGKKYAMIQMKIILAYLMQNFTVTSHQRAEDIQFGWEIVLISNQPVLLSFKPRCQN